MKVMQLYQYQYVPEGSQELGRAARKHAARQTLIKNLEKYGKSKSKYDHQKRNENRLAD